MNPCYMLFHEVGRSCPNPHCPTHREKIPTAFIRAFEKRFDPPKIGVPIRRTLSPFDAAVIVGFIEGAVMIALFFGLLALLSVYGPG